MNMNEGLARRVLFLVFFLSGFTGLIYESLWAQYLKLFLGHAAYAQTLVLIIFMGGMAAGAAVAARYTARVRNLLKGYALVEISIGLLALAFHLFYSAVVDMSFEKAMPGLASPLLVEGYKWGVALLLLLPPSLLLGTTFPLMSGAMLRRYPGMAGGNLATLYFSNSLGGAVGALAATFVLIGSFGLPGTLQFAGILNLLIGISVLLLAKQSELLPVRGDVKSDIAKYRQYALFLIAAFITGAASFIYEVSWIRMLSLVLGSSFHAFELMLSAFIAGLAFGSLAIRRRIDSIANPLTSAASIQVAMGVLAVLTLPVYALSFDWMGKLVTSLHDDEQGYVLFNLASHGIAFAVMLPATFMAGMTLPLFTHALLRERQGEQSIGAIYAANTIGGIAGVVVAMHLALPNVGLKLTLVSGALLDIVLGLVLLRVAGASRMRWGIALAALLVPILALRFVALEGSTLASGVYRTGVAELRDVDMYFYRDGKTSSISVLGAGTNLSIRTNGKPDAAIEMDPSLPPAPDEITMVMAAAVPLAMKPEAKRIANIGFGSGLTTHTLLASPEVVAVETIEIERAMFDGARAFLPRVERAYLDPRSSTHIEDAKSWFARQNARFDIIVSEPSNPWVSGVASLFSDEFYGQVVRYLTDRGLLVQWLNLYEFNTQLAASVIMALDRHFQDYSVYLTDDANILIVASKTGPVPPITQDIFRLGAFSRDLARVGIHNLDDFAFRHVGNTITLRPMLGALAMPVNSDYYPYVELNAPRARFRKEVAVELLRLNLYQLPLDEMLGHSGIPWQFERLTPNESRRYLKAARANEIKRGLSGLPVQDKELREQVVRWRKALAGCKGGDPEAGLEALHEIAIETLAFMDKPGLASLWLKPTWLTCSATQIGSRLAVYQAVATRDAPAMLAKAEGALGKESADTQWERYLLDVGLLAAQALHDQHAVARLWQHHGEQLYSEGMMAPELVLLLNYVPLRH